jgi:hypothetical protein
MSKVFAFVVLAALPIVALADSIQDNINGNATPPYVVYGGPNNIGWYYTANSSYELDGIFTDFEAVPNGTGSRTITEQIWTEQPADGGVLLGSATFVGNSASGGRLGADFAPVTITAGTSYFVDFENTIGMGVDLGQWTSVDGVDEPSAGATVNLDGWYGEWAPNNNDTFPNSSFFGPTSGAIYTTTGTGNVSFAEPILQFEGNPLSASGVPEPSTLLLFLAAGGTALLLRSCVRT